MTYASPLTSKSSADAEYLFVWAVALSIMQGVLLTVLAIGGLVGFESAALYAQLVYLGTCVVFAITVLIVRGPEDLDEVDLVRGVEAKVALRARRVWDKVLWLNPFVWPVGVLTRDFRTGVAGGFFAGLFCTSHFEQPLMLLVGPLAGGLIHFMRRPRL